VPPALQTPQPPLPLDPAGLLARWPGELGLVVLWSGRPGRRRVTLARPEGWVFPETLGELDASWADARGAGALLTGFVSYELGRRLEPAAGAGEGTTAPEGAGWPVIAFVRCREWATWEDAGDGRGRWAGTLDLAAALEEPTTGARAMARAAAADLPGSFALGRLRSRTGRERYKRDVAWIIEQIRAGDVYQVNLAHQLVGSFRGSSRGLFARLVAAADPWHGAYLELPRDGSSSVSRGRRAICSISPELFLEYEPQSRRVTTRPMKGTRPGGGDPAELAGAAKDTAELNMIIDLMRNDLGRSCAFGSVRVGAARAIERHGAGAGGVLQATGDVSGILRPEVSFLEALGMAFPPGSVTGAPKIQAMRMIERLEPVARGPYCGSVCELRADGGATCSVAIRTAVIREVGGPALRAESDPGGPALRGESSRPDWFGHGELTWSVGAGIVADSDPAAEWRETLDKAEVLAAHAGAPIDA
jgi:para-aminobenzoate synthetase component 1